MTTATSSLSEGEVLFLVSIDTEEDNWIPARDNITVENTQQLPDLQRRFTRLGVRPTYFVTDTVAVDSSAAAVIRELASRPDVEIGAHLHPWNTPPLDEAFIAPNTMLHNIPRELQLAKLDRLTRSIQTCLGGRRPNAFRAGRWGIGSQTIDALLECGYTVDSSVTPYTSWTDTDSGPSHLGAPAHTYRLNRGSDVREPSSGPLVEVPPSFGLTRSPLEHWSGVYQAFSSLPGRMLLLDRIAAQTGMLRHATLNPEASPVEDMVELSRVLLREGVRHLHFYFHSPTLLPGLTPFVRTQEERDGFVAIIEEYVHRASELAPLRFATVSEAAALLEPATGTP